MNATEKKLPARAVARPLPAVAAKIAEPVKKASSPAARKAAVAPAKPAAREAAVKPVSKPAAQSAAKDGKAVKAAVSASARPAASAPALAPVRMASAPLKPGRRSSARTAVQTPPHSPMLPTHAPDAAKASYSTMTERVIAPPAQAAAPKDPRLANNWKSKAADQLRDEEVKAMPDAEYMNETQLAFFRHKLSMLKQDIHKSAGETTEHLREDAAVVPDPADRATIEEEHALELRTRDRERKLLKKIEQSIARIDSGDYGYCDETGEPIGVGRLIARPTANLSLEAQQRRELKQKMFGD